MDIPHVQVVKQATALQADLGDERGVVQDVRGALSSLAPLKVELDKSVHRVRDDQTALSLR